MKGFTDLVKESESIDIAIESQIKNAQEKIKELESKLEDLKQYDGNDALATYSDEEECARIFSQINQTKKNIVNLAMSEGTYTIKQLCELTGGTVDCYPGTDVIGDLMHDLQLYHAKNHAMLYSDGRLVFFMTFKDVVTQCRFFMEFFHYEDKFTGEDNPKDGNWHLYFDAHVDPGTGITNKSITFHLIYNAKGNSIKEIDEAVNNMIARLAKKKKEQENWKS